MARWEYARLFVHFDRRDKFGQITAEVSFSEAGGASQIQVAEGLEAAATADYPLLAIAGVLGEAGWSLVCENGPQDRLSVWFRRRSSGHSKVGE